jgi:hypothetical protein
MAAALAVCTMMCNERPYIEEWLAHHKALGVEHFLIYVDQTRPELGDDGTFDHIVALSKDYPLTVYGVPTAIGNRQVRAFQSGIENLRGNAEWVAFIDVDEFLRVDEPLVPWLRTLPAWVDGVAATQLVFGSSGRLTKPNEPVLSAYRRRATVSYHEHAWFKSIVRPQAVTSWRNSHYAMGPTYVTGDGEPLRMTGHVGCSARIPTSGVRLHHYMLKSREEWLAKKAKGALSDHGEFRRFTDQYAERDKDCNQVLDETLAPDPAEAEYLAASLAHHLAYEEARP